jgi:hypothetical protein
MFAKLFGTDADQVLVKIDSGEDGNPEIRFYCEPEGFGICSAAVSFKDDSEKSWNSAKGLFDSIDDAKAKSMGEEIREEIAGITKPNAKVEQAGVQEREENHG